MVSGWHSVPLLHVGIITAKKQQSGLSIQLVVRLVKSQFERETEMHRTPPGVKNSSIDMNDVDSLQPGPKVPAIDLASA